MSKEASTITDNEALPPASVGDDVHALWQRVIGRRSFLKGVGLAGAAALPGSALLTSQAAAQSTGVTSGDLDILRFLAAADASAQEFLRSRRDPLGALVRYLERLLRSLKRPVVVLVDDIDRCDPVAVVRLLEGIHTVFGTLPIVFVVAGDGRWVAKAFEKTYAENAPRSVNAMASRPLGALFLEKYSKSPRLFLIYPKRSNRASGGACYGDRRLNPLPTMTRPWRT